MTIEVISVIAGGWSLTEIDRMRIPGLRIGVNDAAWRLPCTMGVTMDRLFFEGRFDSLVEAYPASHAGAFYFRKGINKRAPAPNGWIPFDCDHTSATMALEYFPSCRLNGLNSGICAINLAFRIKPKRVILWGFDMQRGPRGEPYWHAPYTWAKPGGATTGGKYLEWTRAFGEIANQFRSAGIDLVNASPRSLINTIKKVDPERLLA